MKVIVCGAGQVGFGIARHLAKEGNEVTIIDSSPDLIARIQNEDVLAIPGHGAHPQVLRDANADRADMLIAVTASDEVNMVACTVARNLYKTPKTIARVRDIKYLTSNEETGLFNTEGIAVDVIISPELEVAKAVIRRIDILAAFDSASFGENDEVQMLGLYLGENCPVVNTPLNQLTDLFPTLGAIVVGLRRDDRLYVPDTKDSLVVGDKVYLIVATHDAQRTLKIFGGDISGVRQIVIVGAGNIGLEVARILDRKRYDLMLIETDPIRAQFAAEKLTRRVTVLHGSGLSPESLDNADVRSADMILSLTNDDQVNILSSMLALQVGCAKGMSLINDPAFLNITGRFGMETAINPRAVTISSILQYVRRGSVEHVHTLEEASAEIIEATVHETSPLVGQRISNLHLDDGLRFGAIIRAGKVIKPRGSTNIKRDDRIVLFVLTSSIDEVDKLFTEAKPDG